MTDGKPPIHESDDVPPYEQVRTEEPQAPFGGDEPNPNVVSDATADEVGPEGSEDPAVGGYGGRDPKDEMPRVPSAPDTPDDPEEHSGAPKTNREPPASN